MSLKLEEFLTELICRIRNDNLSDNMTKSLTDIFLLNEQEKAGVTLNSFETGDNIKYYIMGWYIYNSMKK